MGFSRQEHRSGLPCPPPGDHPNPRIELGSPTLQVDSLLSEPPGVKEDYLSDEKKKILIPPEQSPFRKLQISAGGR